MSILSNLVNPVQLLRGLYGCVESRTGVSGV